MGHNGVEMNYGSGTGHIWDSGRRTWSGRAEWIEREDKMGGRMNYGYTHLERSAQEESDGRDVF